MLIRKIIFGVGLFLSCTLLICGCLASKRSRALKDEKLAMQMKKPEEVINLALLKDQSAPSLAMRGTSRGLIVTTLTGNLITMASDAVKNIIAEDRKKYTADYKFGLNDLYFYDQLSNEGPFDPVGMQFKGFTIERTFTDKNNKPVTAFTADFELDTSNIYEIINNSFFRLKVKSFQLKYAKAKVGVGSKKKLNMDIEISFVSSYVSELGMLYDNVTIGKFFLLLRDAPLDPTAPGYDAYYKKLEGRKLTGKSFLVPRSFGYRKENNESVKTFSQGNYSINIKVKECSKESFTSKILVDNTTLILDASREQMKKDVKKKLPKSMQ